MKVLHSCEHCSVVHVQSEKGETSNPQGLVPWAVN